MHYTVLDGKFKELKIPVSSRRQAERMLADGERVDGSSLFLGMVDTALSDLYVVPVYKSAFLNPFDESSLDFTCRYLTRDGALAPFALDNILHKAGSLFRKSTGMDLLGLGELEFFLVSEPSSRIYRAPKQRGYHASGPFVKTGLILDEMVRYIAQITGAVKYAHSEVGYVESVRSDLEEIKDKQAEQLEIEFLPTPVEDAGDNLVLARWLIRNVAYADSLTAFGNTVSAAYLRLVPNQEAPTRICWSDMNRSAMIRVPLGWSQVNNLAGLLNPQQHGSLKDEEGRQTVELRSPDGSAIVHLLLAGISMAAEWGMTHKESLESADKLYVSGNIFRDEKLLQSLTALPKSCVESSRLLLQKRNFYEREGVFPPSIIEYVARLLHAENDEDMNRHLVDLPADDRLHETRKIMHTDLHRH